MAKATRFHVKGSEIGLCVERQVHVYLEDGKVFYLEKCDGKCQEEFDLSKIVPLFDFWRGEVEELESALENRPDSAEP